MKKTILSAMLMTGLVVTLYGQQVFIDTTGGGGLIIKQGATQIPLPAGEVINAQLFGGTNANSMSPIVSVLAPNLLAAGGGLIYDLSGLSYTIPNVSANADAFLSLQFWIGPYTSYALAQQAGGFVGDSGVFQNHTGGGGVPASIPAALTGMPNVIVSAVPEPSTVALAGLGAAALLMYRRRQA
jgi:hypothetical protein